MLSTQQGWHGTSPCISNQTSNFSIPCLVNLTFAALGPQNHLTFNFFKPWIAWLIAGLSQSCKKILMLHAAREKKTQLPAVPEFLNIPTKERTWVVSLGNVGGNPRLPLQINATTKELTESHCCCWNSLPSACIVLF